MHLRNSRQELGFNQSLHIRRPMTHFLAIKTGSLVEPRLVEFNTYILVLIGVACRCFSLLRLCQVVGIKVDSSCSHNYASNESDT